MKTPEHFEKKDYLKAKNGIEKLGMIGYNRALEKTNAKELYEVLTDMFEYHYNEKVLSAEAYQEMNERAQKAIEKANKP